MIVAESIPRAFELEFFGIIKIQCLVLLCFCVFLSFFGSWWLPLSCL